MFGERLQSLRKEKGLLQKDIAEMLKVSTSTIGMYEQGRRDPDTETVRILAEFFNVSIDSLLGHSESHGKSSPTLSVSEQLKLDKKAQEVIDTLALSLSKNKEHLSEIDYQVLAESIRSAIETIKLKNKEKYNPNKNKTPKL